MEQLLKPAGVARLLDVHISTVYRWINSGVLPAKCIGGTRYRVRREDALAMEIPVEPRRQAAGGPCVSYEAAAARLKARGVV
jgi:excisionase family DNA binding protein